MNFTGKLTTTDRRRTKDSKKNPKPFSFDNTYIHK